MTSITGAIAKVKDNRCICSTNGAFSEPAGAPAIRGEVQGTMWLTLGPPLHGCAARVNLSR